MKTEFTKGDWITGNTFGYAVGVPEKNLIVCDCSFDHDVPNQEQLANAKLISSAPDLYDALKLMVGWSAHLPNIADEDLLKAKEALLKAIL